jgi:hypothetical protein
MKILPIGIQDFETIIKGNFVYVDKTKYYYDTFETGKFYFFSRPRRFGKSLFLSSLKYLYQGRKDLFKGLWIEDNWNWDLIYPVIHVDLSKIDTRKSTLQSGLMAQMTAHAKNYGIELNGNSAAECFVELIHKLGQGDQKCVVLVDEYDKPITDYITDPETSEQHVKELKSFYGILKSSDPYLQKVIITGVSKYGKVSIFSDLNNLHDVSMSPVAAKACGYTQEELESYFDLHIEAGLAKYDTTKEDFLARIKNWYNGYIFDDEMSARLYNPFSILNFFASYRLKNYWFETGTPTFLTELLAQDQFDPARLEYLKTTDILFKSADLSHIDALSLLYQTGYLTIKDINGSFEFQRYILGFPNQEVRLSFMSYLLAEYAQETPSQISTNVIVKIQDALWEKDWPSFFECINGVFATVPYLIFKNQEAYYHALVHVILTLSGHLVLSEVLTNKGRIDSVLETEQFIVIFEFKMDSSAQVALAQIHEKGYAERYGKTDKALVLIGVNFDSKERKITDWVVE